MLCIAELNTEETILYFPCRHFLRDSQAHSFLPLIIIDDFPFSGYIMMSFATFLWEVGSLPVCLFINAYTHEAATIFLAQV